jgi:hypothetical protein
VKLTHEGLSLWYGTPDAPAPLDEVVARDGAALIAGVYPANPTNALNVRYRVDGGVVQTAAGRQLHTDYDKNSQYFTVPFPAFPVGNVVEYCPIFSCGGRQVPSPARAEQFPSQFRLAPVEARRSEARVLRPNARSQQIAPELEFLADVTIQIDQPLFIGETPEGVRIDFFALGGTVVGPKLNGRIVPRSSDHLFVRSDGIGVIRVRAIIATNDGTMLEVEDTGSIDFGADGYQRARANDLPAHSTLVICPRILASNAKYQWLNRLQCLGVGRTQLEKLTVQYDLFAVGVRELARPS